MGLPSRDELERYRLDIRRHMPPVFEALEDELDHLTGFLKETPRLRDIYDVALIAHVLRATDASASVVRLAEYGHGEMSLGASRVVFEAMVSAYWMSIEPAARAEQYEQFAGRENHDMLSMLSELGIAPAEGYGSIPEHIESRKVYVEQFRSLAQGWTRRPMKQRVDEIAAHYSNTIPEGLLLFHAVANTLGNRMLHMGTTEAAERLKAKALGPHKLTAVWSSYALHLATWAYGWLIHLAAARVGFTDANEWKAHLRSLMLRCEPVTSIKCVE